MRERAAKAQLLLRLSSLRASLCPCRVRLPLRNCRLRRQKAACMEPRRASVGPISGALPLPLPASSQFVSHMRAYTHPCTPASPYLLAQNADYVGATPEPGPAHLLLHVSGPALPPLTPFVPLFAPLSVAACATCKSCPCVSTKPSLPFCTRPAAGASGEQGALELQSGGPADTGRAQRGARAPAAPGRNT